MNFEGKNVLYVGGFGGIGFATCKQLMAKNVKHLVILDKTLVPEKLQELKELNQNVIVSYFAYDLTATIEQMRSVFKDIQAKIQSIHVLINGAGICNDHHIEQTLQINLAGPIKTTKTALDFMDKRIAGNSTGGLIVNVASVAGLNPVGNVCVYSASKAGVISFTRSLAHLHSYTGVVAMAICPGITDTGILENIGAFMSDDVLPSETFNAIGKQTAADCAVNFVRAMETYKNGAIWMLDQGKMIEVEMPNFWEVPKELL